MTAADQIKLEGVEINGDVLTISLPGQPAAKVSGPAYETWAMRRYVGSASQKESEYGLVVDLSKQLDAVVQAWAAEEETSGFIRTRKGDLAPFEPGNLDRTAKVEDVAFIALKLCQLFYPANWPTPRAEGNDDKRQEGKGSGKQSQKTLQKPRSGDE